MNIQKIFIAFFLFAFCQAVSAQVQRDQDLITLKNGYQILGYIIEQQPGKLIKIYRPEMNDTIDARMEDVSKLNKIWVQNFSEKKVEAGDSLVFGRYNNKKNVFMASYIWQQIDIENRARKGVGISYFRNKENKFWFGFSAYAFGRQDPNPSYADDKMNSADFSFKQYQFLSENKMRLRWRPQNKRLTTLFTLNAGLAVDLSHNSFNSTPEQFDIEYEQFNNGFLFQSGLAFRVNPDNNSGFLVEPGYTYSSHIVEQYSAKPGSDNSIYLGYRKQFNHMLTLKLSYFF
jgi:hypothetical protein